ncbi:calcium/sodium antiporter [Rhodoflexus caldus]|uniref:calcium/sodium antiporter n=1 Tax=Rhodoflexus caldus TaxID=2891236 RepID=UPI00202A4A90|nr:calcium/sodium antiporter [Rhodoflexus caldus]
MTYFLFVVGVFLLIFGANWLVDGASSLAKRFNVSDLTIGLTVVALGTSAPEMIVNLTAGIQGSTDMAIGNAIGSNIFNVMVILGLSAVLNPVDVKHNTIWKEIPLCLLAAVVAWLVANDTLFNGEAVSVISRSEGLLMLCFFGIFMYYVTDVARSDTDSGEPITVLPLYQSIAYILLGIGGLVVGGKWIVEGGIAMARAFQVSEAVIGLTIISAGTSLPELATSAVAAYKKNSDIAIGNVVGSNIMNIFLILGASAVVTPLPFNPAMNTELLINIGISIAMFVFLFTGKGRRIDRWEGGVLLTIYIAYISLLIYQQ